MPQRPKKIDKMSRPGPKPDIAHGYITVGGYDPEGWRMTGSERHIVGVRTGAAAALSYENRRIPAERFCAGDVLVVHDRRRWKLAAACWLAYGGGYVSKHYHDTCCATGAERRLPPRCWLGMMEVLTGQLGERQPPPSRGIKKAA